MSAAEPAVADALGRAAAYRILSLAFAHPTPERLAQLAQAVNSLSGLAALPPDVADALRALGAAAADADPAAVADEHVFLFDRAVRCPPYEGAYGPAPQMAGKGAVLADIAGFYAAFGLAPEGGQPETEDHVTAELEFMSALSLKEGWALSCGEPAGLEVTRQARRLFLSDHLGRWADAFAQGLREATLLPFYAAAADLLVRWIAAETRALGVTPEPLGAMTPRSPDESGPLTCPMGESTGGD